MMTEQEIRDLLKRMESERESWYLKANNTISFGEIKALQYKIFRNMHMERALKLVLKEG
jgi:hypothetical protein